MAPRRRTSMGRQKIEIRPIESEPARQVCFSKRRAGLFNKVSEFSTLCGAEVAVVVFSPGGKAFSFGQPSVDSVVDRFISSNSSEVLAPAVVDGAAVDRNLALEELNRKLGDLRAQVAAMKARDEALDESFAKARADGCQAMAWLDPDNDMSKIGEEDLVAFAAGLDTVRADVAVRCGKILQEALLFGRPVHGGRKFELGGTSAIGGMEMTQQQMMTMMQQMPPPPGFNAGTEMMQQQQQQMMMMQQQQMMEMTALPPPTGFDAGAEMMQQQQMMMAMPPSPPLPGFSVGMETVHQGFGFGPHGFLQ